MKEFTLSVEEALRRAKEVVAGYAFEFKVRNGKFVGFTREMPGVSAVGASYEECHEQTVIAQVEAVAALLRRGIAPPTSQDPRTEQVNLRLPSGDKARLQRAAIISQKSVSEFVREAALAAAERLGA